jgi:WD40 repeat protein
VKCYQYDAFLSYRRLDATRVAQWIRRRLQRFRLPLEILRELPPEKQELHKRRPRVWLDTSYEKANDDFLVNRIFPALDDSARLIVVCTPSTLKKIVKKDGSAEENWLVREVDHFLGSAAASRASRPIDLVLGPGAVEGSYPGRLSEKPRWDWIDFRSFNSWRARTFSEALDDGLTKLVASLYDVPDRFLPVLRREERRQRVRWIVVSAVGSFLMAALIAVLAFWGYRNAVAALESALIARAQISVRLSAEELQKKDPGRALATALAGVDTLESINHDRAVGADLITAVANSMANATFEATLPDHADAVIKVSLDAEGTSAITVGANNQAIFWAGGDGLPLRPKESRTLAGEVFTISKDNALIAYGATDGQVQFWSPSRPELSPKSFEFGESLAALTFDETGRRVAILGAAGKLGVWDIEMADFVWETRRAISDASTIAFGANCSCLVVGTTAGDLLVWSIGRKDPNVVRGASEKVTWAAFGRDGHFLFGTDDNKVWLTSAPSWPPPMNIGRHDRTVTVGVVSPDGKLALTITVDGAAWLWDLRCQCKQLKPEEVAITSATFSPNGDTIALGRADGDISFWDVSDRYAAPSETLVLRGHAGSVVDLQFSPDGNLIASASLDRTARIWGVHTARRPRIVQAHTGAGFHSASRNGHYIISGSGIDKKVQVWVGPKWLSTRSIYLEDSPNALAISDDGKRAFIGTAKGEILDWNTESAVSTKIAHDAGMVGSIEISPDEKRLAAIGVGARRLICSLSTPPECHTAPMSGWGSSVAFSQDGRWLGATSGSDQIGDAVVWDVQPNTSVPLKGHAKRVSEILFDRAGTRAITVSTDGTARIWDLFSGKELVRLVVPTVVPDNPRLAIAGFGANDEWVATCADERTVRLWKIPKLIEPSQLPLVMGARDSILVFENTAISEKENIVQIRFGLDGNIIVGSLKNGKINVWHVSGGRPGRKLRSVLEGDGSPIQNMQLRNERHLTALTEKGNLVSWSIQPAQSFSDEKLLSFARGSIPLSGALRRGLEDPLAGPSTVTTRCTFLQEHNIGLPPHNISGAARARQPLTLLANCNSDQIGKASALFEGLVAEAESNISTARQRFTAALEQEESSADIGLGDLRFLDPVNGADIRSARTHFTRALQSGAPHAASRLGWLLLADGTTESRAQARRYFEEGAKTGDADGFAGLGWINERFSQSPQDLERAFISYIQAQYAYERDGDLTLAKNVAERRAMLARLFEPEKVGELFLSGRRSIDSHNAIERR